MIKKYLFITLMLFSFLSCTSDRDDITGSEDIISTPAFDDWNSPQSPNYKPNGYNPIKGTWMMEDSDYTLIFTDDFEFKDVYYEGGAWAALRLRSTYKINNTTFKTDKEIPYSQDKIDTFPYKLGTDEEGEYLDIAYPLGTTRYYRLK